MRAQARLRWLGLLAAVLTPGGLLADKPKGRTFEFTYAATIKELNPAKKVRTWVPVPSSSPDQDVKLIALDIQGAEKSKGKLGTEKGYGNRMHFAEVRPDGLGRVSLKFVYRVTRLEVKGETALGAKEDSDRIARYLEPDELVPIKGKPLELLSGRKLPAAPLAKARVLYDVVNGHLSYRKDRPGWGRGDSVWACASKAGNCSDFHSLFISLARSEKIPAKFEIGFSLPEKHGSGDIGGYHCWAFFRPGNKGWVPVDIAEANKNPKLRDYYFGNLTADRMTFSVGRDITLTPKQSGKPLNFFIYPHAEVDGKEWPQGKIEKTFSFKDVK
jgi:transglutaminase-like putative cysteine protease